jgi:hypothetical protein
MIVRETPGGILVNGEYLHRATPLRNRPITCETFLCGGVVIKIDSQPVDEDFSQTQWEADMWDWFEEADLHYFTEVLDYGIFEDKRGWIVKRYYNLRDEGRVPIRKFERHLLPIIRKYDIGDVNYDWNCAINADTGLPIIFDWGI